MAAKNNQKKKIKKRPLDPTRNASDLIADTSGLTGITIGSPRQTSAEPDDIVRDDEHLPASLKNSPQPFDTGIPKEAVNDKVYNKNALQGVSDAYAKQTEDNDFPQPEIPSIQGEQSVSGDMPDPSSDDDTLANAQEVGTQLDEDEEHPKELDIGSDIDKAEKFHEEH